MKNFLRTQWYSLRYFNLLFQIIHPKVIESITTNDENPIITSSSGHSFVNAFIHSINILSIIFTWSLSRSSKSSDMDDILGLRRRRQYLLGEKRKRREIERAGPSLEHNCVLPLLLVSSGRSTWWPAAQRRRRWTIVTLLHRHTQLAPTFYSMYDRRYFFKCQPSL